MSAIIQVSEQNFEANVVQTAMPVLLDFTAVWCGPCKALLPALEDLATAFEGRARIIKIDIDDSPALAERYAVKGVPTLILMHRGEERGRMMGAQTRGKLAAALEMLIPDAV